MKRSMAINLTLGLFAVAAAGCGSEGTPSQSTGIDILGSEPTEDTTGSVVPDDIDETPNEDVTSTESDDAGPADNDTEACVASCEDKDCGDDGCGGTCGDCVDDGGVCADAICDAGVCTTVFTESECDDENPCTTGDLCAEGVCNGTPMDCDDENDCTDNWCNQGVCMTEASEEEACELVITIESPARASTFQSVNVVNISGTVSSPAALIDHITINGEDVGVTNEGTFTTNMVPKLGLNIILAKASNSLEQEDQVAQSYIHGETFHPLGSLAAPAMLDDVMGLWLSPEAFDDNNTSDVDDFSTLAYMVLNGLDLNSLMPNPLFAQDERPSFLGCDYDVTVSNISMSVDEVEFAPVDGGLHAYIEVEDLYAYISAESDDGIIGDNCADAKGPVTATQVSIDAKMTVTVVNGKPEVSIAEGDLTVILHDFDWTLEEGLASAFDWLIGLVMGTIENKVIEALETQMYESIVPLVNNLLNDFTAYERLVVIPPFRTGGQDATLNLKVALHDATFAETGVHLSLEVGSATDPEIDDENDLGSLGDATCEDVPMAPFAKLPKTSAAEAYLDVDLSNQMLYNLWLSGYIHTTITDDTLGDTTAEYGLSDPHITIEPLLPPILHTCTDLGDAELQLGDIHVVADFQTATGPLTLDLYASATVGADLTVFDVPDAADGLGIESVTPGTVVLDLQAVEGTLAFSDEVIELLLASLVSDVLAGDLLSGLIGTFPLPSVTIGGYVPGLPDDTKLNFHPATIEGVGAHLILGGGLAAE